MSYAGADIKPESRLNVSPRVGHIVAVTGAQAVAVIEKSPTAHHRVEIGALERFVKRSFRVLRRRGNGLLQRTAP